MKKGTPRRFRTKPRTRLKKTGAARRRRDKVQKKRLVALGVDAEKVGKMSQDKVRLMLRKPLKTKKALARKTAKK